jgi:hypothetical protein
MKQLEPFSAIDFELRDAQRIIDEVHENPLHPANDRRHPLHQQASAAIYALEARVFELAVPDNILRVNAPKVAAKGNKSKHDTKCA